MKLKDMYFTISEAAKELGVSRQSIYRWVNDKKIPTEKIGGVILVEKVALQKYFATRVTEDLWNMFDSIAFDSVRQELGYSDKDIIERLDNEGDYLVFLVTRENGVQEKVVATGSELTLKSGPKISSKNPMSAMKIKFTGIIRKDYKKPKDRSKSRKVKKQGVVS